VKHIQKYWQIGYAINGIRLY